MNFTDWLDFEPTDSDLAEIEAEWPVIAAELSILDRLAEFDAILALEDRQTSLPTFSMS